jgi:tRNA threonylcarbamoyladenosine biosynthesis protein TsaE
MKTTTASAAATRALGGRLAQAFRPGDVVVLAGDLGAGKTTFVQGVATALGVEEPVTSPTFTIVHEYEGRLPLVHVDVYRLDRLAELYDLGLEDIGNGAGVMLIEWGDIVAQALPPDRLVVRLELGADDDERIISFAAHGASWRARVAQLEQLDQDLGRGET